MVKFCKEEEEKAIALHKKAIVVDACSPLISWDVRRRRNKGEKAVLKNILFPEMRKGGVDVAVTTVYDPFPLFGEPDVISALETISVMSLDLDESCDKVTLVLTARDIEKANKEGKLALLFGFQGLPPLKGRLSYLRIFYQLGVRIIQLTYNERNEVGDGCAERSKGGLSNFGIRVVEELNRLGIIIDLSHVGEATFMDTLEVSKEPVIASHSNSCAVFDHFRNLSVEQIKALAEKGGVVGVTAYSPIVKGVNPTIEDLIDHIDYITKLVGVNHVGLGLDLIYYTNGPDLYPDSYVPWTEEIITKGIEDAPKIPNITEGLVRRGYSDRDIEKILGGNFLRIFEKILAR